MNDNSYFIMTKNSDEANRLKKEGYELVSDSYGVFCFIDKDVDKYDSKLKASETIKTKMLFV